MTPVVVMHQSAKMILWRLYYNNFLDMVPKHHDMILPLEYQPLYVPLWLLAEAVQGSIC